MEGNEEVPCTEMVAVHMYSSYTEECWMCRSGTRSQWLRKECRNNKIACYTQQADAGGERAMHGSASAAATYSGRRGGGRQLEQWLGHCYRSKEDGGGGAQANVSAVPPAT